MMRPDHFALVMLAICAGTMTASLVHAARVAAQIWRCWPNCLPGL
jgi:hypothetical protein